MQGIGVLEFIDDAIAIALPQQVQKALGIAVFFGIEILFDGGDHVVKALLAAHAFVGADRLVQFVDGEKLELAGELLSG